jgi:aminopeptidase N
MPARHRAQQLLHAGPAGFAGPGARPQYMPDLPLEPEHMELEAWVELGTRTVRVSVVHSLRATRDGARTLRLDGVDLLALVVDDPDGEALEWRYDGDAVHITWATPRSRDQRCRVRVRYEVQDPLTGMLFRGQGEGRFAATDHETERARHWLCCVDHPAVRTTLAMRIRAETGLTVLANGERGGCEDHDDGTSTTTWTCAERCPSYLLCILVGDLVRHDAAPWGETPLAWFAPRPTDPETLQRSFGGTADMLSWITQKLDRPLPWPKYFQFAVPAIGGAMENISLVSWDAAFLADDRLRAEIGWLIDVINLHEMAHTWFGDRVVCREFAHSWLKESWATYMEVVWLEDTQGVDRSHVHLLDDLHTYTTEADGRYVRPIVTREFDSSWDLFDAHLYPGGAWRLHMLRREIGDVAFWEGTHAYLTQFDEEVAETDDLRRCLEEAAGRPLARFFDMWLRAPGYPKLKASWSHEAESGLGTLKVEQTQVDSDKGVGVFQFPLTVAIEETDGEWSRHTLRVDGAEAMLVLPLPAAPLQVVLDPDCGLAAGLEFDPGVSMLTRGLTACPHVRGRVHAATTLAKRGRAGGISAIESAWSGEQEWGVRRWWARALGTAATTHAAGALARLLATESDPRVQSALTAAAHGHPEPEMALALRAWLDTPGRPWRAQAEALKSLGRQRDEADVARLETTARGDGWWAWTQRGAVQGLGEHATPAAAEALLRLATDASLLEPAVAALGPALGAAASRCPRPVRARAQDALERLGRDPRYRVRMGAAGGMAALAEPGAAARITSLERAAAAQDVPRLRRLARGLRAGDGGVAALRKQVDELETRLRAVAERVRERDAKDA